MKKICLSMMLVSLLLAGCSSQSHGGETAYVVEKMECYTNGELSQTYEYVFNDDGLPISGTIKDKNGNKHTQLESTLNENGKISKITFSKVDYDDVSYNIYDDNGNHLSYKTAESEDKNTYNEKNQLVKSQLYDKDNQLLTETVYNYDENGKKSSVEYYTKYDSLILGGISKNFTYDEKGYVTGYQNVYYTYNSDGEKIENNQDVKYENHYDDNGNLVECSFENAMEDMNGNMQTTKYTYKYTYKTINVNTAEEKEYIEKFNFRYSIQF